MWVYTNQMQKRKRGNGAEHITTQRFNYSPSIKDSGLVPSSIHVPAKNAKLSTPLLREQQNGGKR